MFLEALELPLTAGEKPYFYKGQVEAVKAVQHFLAEHMSEDFSQDELAERFGISQTMMKNVLDNAIAALGDELIGYYEIPSEEDINVVI